MDIAIRGLDRLERRESVQARLGKDATNGARSHAGLLRDGRYVLTILASQVTSLGIALDGDGDGNPGDNYVIGADEADRFYRKYGDGNGNGTVDVTDFGSFRRTFGERPGSDAWNRIYDDEGDGTIGVEDFAQFRRNFGT